MGGIYLNRLALFALVAAALLLVSMGAFAASSSGRFTVKITKESFFQFRGVDSPHVVTNFRSWPGLTTYVHSNCYHVHGEFKTVSASTGRELSSKSLSVPLYCKGLTKYIGQAISEGKALLKGISASTYLRVGGTALLFLTSIPTVGNPGNECVCTGTGGNSGYMVIADSTDCTSSKPTNSSLTKCHWEDVI